MGSKKGGGDGGQAAIMMAQMQAQQALQQGQREGYGFLDEAKQAGLKEFQPLISPASEIAQKAMGTLADFENQAQLRAQQAQQAYMAPAQRKIQEQLNNLYSQAGIGGRNSSRAQQMMARTADEMAFNEAARQKQLEDQVRQQVLGESVQLYQAAMDPLKYQSGVELDTGKSKANTAVGTGSQLSGMYQSTGSQLAQAQERQQQQRQNGKQTAIGGLATLGGQAMTMMSDKRLKENIKAVGKLDNGLTVYVFNYKGQTVPQLGLIAQEVQEVRPEAVYENANGFLSVDYREAVK